jgi:hypothetical protein
MNNPSLAATFGVGVRETSALISQLSTAAGLLVVVVLEQVTAKAANRARRSPGRPAADHAHQRRYYLVKPDADGRWDTPAPRVPRWVRMSRDYSLAC